MGSFALPFYHLASQVGMSSVFPFVMGTNSVLFVRDELGLSFTVLPLSKWLSLVHQFVLG